MMEATERFERWLRDLRKSGYPGISDLSFRLVTQEKPDFGAWLHSGRQEIELHTGSLTMIRTLIDEVVEKENCLLVADLFPEVTPEARKETVDLLQELAFQWLMAHELSHWLLGHPEFLFRKFPQEFRSLGLAEIPLGISEPSEPLLDSSENVCAELQADSHAIELLDYLYTVMPEGESSPFEIHSELCSEDNSFLRLRLVCVAAGIVMLLLDTLRKSSDYPSPPTRIFNLLKMIFAVANKEAIQFRATGPVLSGSEPETLEALDRSLRETIFASALDLLEVSDILGIEITLVEFRESSSPTLMDLLRTSGIQEGSLETEGARDFAKWEEFLYANMREIWLPYSRIDVWKAPPEE